MQTNSAKSINFSLIWLILDYQTQPNRRFFLQFGAFSIPKFSQIDKIFFNLAELDNHIKTMPIYFLKGVR